MNPFIQMPRILFDFGAITALPQELHQAGVTRPLVVTDAGLVECGAFDRIREIMRSRRGFHAFQETPENPTIDGADRAFEAFRAENCDGVVALGGGSVIDTAKMVAVLAGHGGSARDFVGRPDKVTSDVVPLVAIPTTASSGSEVSPGCGIHPDSSTRAVGTRSHFLVPRVAICDPELTFSLSPRLTAGTGMDALSHCIEGYLSKANCPPLDAIALGGIRHVCEYIERAVNDGQDREARWYMLLAGLEGGMAIAKGLGPAHAIANTFGDRGFHHGMLCAVSLPESLDVVGKHVPKKIKRIAEAMNLERGKSVSAKIRELNVRVAMPATLREVGFTNTNIDEMAEDAAASPFNRSSPYAPAADEFRTMIRTLIG
jgi:4-hydroxybutyrate dehydrogenase